MKKIILKISIFLALIPFIGCELDNFDSPNAILEGQVVYGNQPINVRSNSAELELWQDGFALNEFIPVFIAQDGSYSVSLFEGEYKMVRKNGDPWLPQLNDTIVIQVNGNTQQNVPVTLYLNIQEATFETTGNNITASFEIEKVVESTTFQYATLMISESILLDQNINNASLSVNADELNPEGNSTISIEVPENLRNLDYLFVRLGVKASSSNELIYSEAQRVNL